MAPAMPQKQQREKSDNLQKNSLTICITCAGNQKCPKPDAAIPRQVDAVVRA